MSVPLQIYCNWSAYDELSDVVELDNSLAMRQLNEVLRLRRAGVRIDAYLMDCFWYDPALGYRKWRTPHFPDEGQEWLDTCREHGLIPGVWIGSNSRTTAKVTHPDWAESLASHGQAYCLFHGKFLDHLAESLRLLYARGVRLFKFDFLDQNAAPADIEEDLLQSEIRRANSAALQGMLSRFRREHPDTVFTAYNGYEEVSCQHRTDLPQRHTMDRRWLDGFDCFYPGDPRPSDLPATSLWRSKDVYTDHMVRFYHAQGFPLAVVDNAGFMVGNTGTCYGRGAAGWKVSAILALARGGSVTTWYGDLALLNDADAAWLARVQSAYLALQTCGATRAIGGIPGRGETYGWLSSLDGDALVVGVNPGLEPSTLDLPGEDGQLLFSDAGVKPRIVGRQLLLPPGQVALIGFGSLAAIVGDLGSGDGEPVPEAWRLLGRDNARIPAKPELEIQPPGSGRLLAVLRQRDSSGGARRTSGGSAPNGVPLDRLLRISADQGGQPVPIRIVHDRMIWSGISWGVGILDTATLDPNILLHVVASSSESAPLDLELSLYHDA